MNKIYYLLLYIILLYACAPRVRERAQPIVAPPQPTKPAVLIKQVALVYITDDLSAMNTIIAWCEKYPDIPLTIALPLNRRFPIDPTSGIYKKMLSLIADNKLEVALRLPHEPILPLIAQTNDAAALMGKRGALPVPAFNWPVDIRQQIANAREKYFKLWGCYPRGFVPAGGWLSAQSYQTLRGWNIAWCVTGSWENNRIASVNNKEYPYIFFTDKYIQEYVYQTDPAIGYSLAVDELLTYIRESDMSMFTIVCDDSIYQKKYKRSLISFINNLGEVLSRQTDTIQCITPTAPYAYTLSTRLALKQIPICSWYYTDLSWWIGDEEENAAWGLLGHARAAVEDYQNSGKARIVRLNAALDELYEAEASAYFYVFGNEDDTEKNNENEQTFRAGLINVFRMIGVEPPEVLYHSLEEIAGYSHAAQTISDTAIEIGPGYVRWRDTSKDDYGSGDIQYPLPEAAYPAGSFDIESFSVSYNETTLFCDIIFSYIQPAVSSPMGLDLQLIDIYIDINNRRGAGATKALSGRDFYIEAADAWEYAFTINGWGCTMYRSVAGNTIKKIDGDIHLAVNHETNTVTVTLPRSILRGDPLNWGYVVAVMGYDTLKTAETPQPLPVVNNPQREHVFRGTWAGYTPPPLIDILTPPGKDQQKLLGVYRQKLPVTVPAIRIKE